MGGYGSVDGAVGHPRRDSCTADGAEQATLKSLDVGRVNAHQIGNAAGENVTEDAKAGAQHGFRFELPGDCHPWLQDRERSRRENVAETGLNGGVERLSHVMRDRGERARQSGDLAMRIEWIGIQGVAQAEGPGQISGYFPGVLRVKVEIQKVERLVGGRRKSPGCRGGDSVNVLRQGGEGHSRNRTFAEIVIVQAEDSRIGSEAQFVRAVTPGKVVVDEEAGCAPALHPGVVQSSDAGEWSVGAAALQHNRKCGKCFLKVVGRKQALVPGKSRIEIVHQMLGKDVRVSGRERVERLRRNCIEQGVDGVGPRGLQAGVGLKAEPGNVLLVEVVVDASGLDLLVVVAGVRDTLAIRATVSVIGNCGRASAYIEGTAEYG